MGAGATAAPLRAASVAALLLCWALRASSYSVEVGEHGPLIRREARQHGASLLAPSGGGEAEAGAGDSADVADEPSVGAGEALVQVDASDEPAPDVGQPCESILLKAKKLLEAYVKKYKYSSAFASSVAEAKDVLNKLSTDANKPSEANASTNASTNGLTAVKLTSLVEGVFPDISAETRDKLQTALGKVGLATAMSTGDVWTVEDQTGLWSGCPPKGEQLEEHTVTAPHGERIIQGDIVVPSGSGESLAEADYPGNAADYWLYNRSHSVVRWCPGPSTSAAAEAAFVNAAAHIEAQVPCVTFYRVQRKDFSSCSELPSVMVTSEKTGCWSHLGQVSGSHNRGAGRYKQLSQRLNLGPGCELLGMAARQLMRALGVRNELARTDRDEFVSVFKDRATKGHENFALNTWPPPQAYKGHSFDLLSLMMPPARAFSSTGEVTVEPKGEPKLRHYLGQRMGLSQLDAERLAERYGCPDNARPVEPSAYLTAQMLLGKKGTGMQKRCGDLEYTNFFAGQRDKPISCAELLGACGLDHDGAQVRKVCASTCMRCVPEPAGLFDEVATPRPTEAMEVLPAVTECVDALDTGFAFASGVGRTCTELVGYCEDKDIGSQVKVACPLTCGRCDLTGFGLSGRPFVGTAACADLPAYAPPHFKEAGGTVLECSQLKDHCKNGEHTDYVSRKCPATCGVCKELEMNKKVDAEMAALRAAKAKATTTTTTTTTTTSMREIEFNLKDATERGTNTDGVATNETNNSSNGNWCTRRRRWGYCYSRRRRLD